MNNKYITKSKRLKRFLYLLGFEFDLVTNSEGKEQYEFYDTCTLQESVEFYYKIRKTFQK